MNTSTSVLFKGSTLTWGKVSRTFKYEIEIAIVTPQGVLVQFSACHNDVGPRNISLYDSSLQEIWQIQDIDLPNPARNFMNLHLHEDGKITCTNSDWGFIITDLTTGSVQRTRLVR